jgi:hypothetical protein
MGSGIELAIQEKWPVVFEEYSELIKTNPTESESRARLGMLIMVEVEPGLFVGNIVGQQFYGMHEPRHAPRYTSYDAIDRALVSLNGWIRMSLSDPPVIHYLC